MNQTQKPISRRKKIATRIVVGVLALVMLLAVSIYGLWYNEISTIASIRLLKDRNDAHLDGAVYTMHVRGGFYLDDFVAQGGVKNDSELIDFITSKITKGLVDMKISNPEIGCSSFTARSESGDRLFGRNYDFSKTNTCIVFTEANRGRHASISTADLQFLGIDVEKNLNSFMDKVITLAATYTPLDGINDAGVSCGIYMTYQGGEKTIPTDQTTQKPDLTSTTLLRLILDYADSVEEAVSIAASYDLHDSAKTSYHYMVADSSGKSAILEWVANTDSTDNDGAARELVVTYHDEDTHIGALEGATDYQVITNFIIQPGYYEGSPTEDKKGLDRYEKIYEELNKTNGVVQDEQAAMDILQTVGRRNWKNDDKNGCTVHSVVYNMTDKSMVWVPNENYDDPNSVYEFHITK